jgi:hypothetical protein
LNPFRQKVAYLFNYAFVATYFFVWSYKTQIRHSLRFSSLAILSFSTLLLLIEVSLKWAGIQRIHELLINPYFVHFQKYLFILFVAAVLYLIWHAFQESKKPDYEYGFVQQLTQFVQERSSGQSNLHDLIPRALELFFQVFGRAKIMHCSLYTFDGEELGIQSSYVYPETDDADYHITLNKGEGVAGRVCEDKNPRYVPRLYFPFFKRWKWVPTIYFPHAVQLKFQETADATRLVNVDLDLFSFQSPPSENIKFRSFVSVPVKAVAQENCFGVLNFDFRRHDPLDKSDIAMAVVFGLLLGDEIERVQSQLQVERR